MPTCYCSDSYNVYLNTFGELEGSQACDFNVDFDRGSELAKLLEDFMVEMNLYARDLCFRPSVLYTYERDDSLVSSHILCSHNSSMPFSNVYSVHSGSISCDHFSVFFQ